MKERTTALPLSSWHACLLRRDLPSDGHRNAQELSRHKPLRFLFHGLLHFPFMRAFSALPKPTLIFQSRVRFRLIKPIPHCPPRRSFAGLRAPLSPDLANADFPHREDGFSRFFFRGMVCFLSNALDNVCTLCYNCVIGNNYLEALKRGQLYEINDSGSSP